MTNAGWYPDPAGAPNTYRYWDGQAWSDQTSSNPFGNSAPQPPPPPGPASPPPPQASPSGGSSYGAIGPAPDSFGQGGYGQGGYGQGGPWGPGSGGPGDSGSGGGSKGKTVGIVLGGVGALVILALIAFFAVRAVTGGEDDNSARDDDSSQTSDSDSDQDDDTDTDSDDDESPTDGQSDPSPPSLQVCNGGSPASGRPNTGDTITGGTITMPALRDEGYTIDHGYASAFTFADRISTIYQVIEESDPDTGVGWVSTGGVGSLRTNTIESLQQGADVVMACMANNPALYSGFTGMTELESGPTTVDGKDAYSVTAEIRVEADGLEAEGDVVQVVTVDIGNPRQYGLYIFAVPIGDDDLIAVQEQTFKELTVK